MIVLFKNIKQNSVMIFDAEYNQGDLIQFSGILFRKIEKDIFQIEKSLTIYVKLESGYINPFIREYTGITDEYLQKNGVKLRDAQKAIYDLIDVGEEELLVVSHGIYNDRQTLLNNGIDLYVDKNFRDIQGLCTYNASKRLLERETNLSLSDIAAEAGTYLTGCHNAFQDAWATISIFCLLCKLEEERKNEKILLSRK